MHHIYLQSAVNINKIVEKNNVLVIGYGNDLGSDDGIGQRVANELDQNSHFTNLQSLAVHQLTPELTQKIFKADLVIFVDACLNWQSSDKSLIQFTLHPDVRVRILEPDNNTTLRGHTTNPESRLTLLQVI